MLNRDQLDELSRLFAERLFEKYPEWEAAARHNPEQPLSFCVEWESPVKGRSIGCSTEDEEITVWFGDWHAHFGDYREQSDLEAVEEAIEYVSAILSDEVVVVATYEQGSWSGSTSLPAAEATIVEKPGIETRIHSWSGRLDRVKK